ncbi:MAG: prolyl oligopeptidase family serine peptidase [Polyangiaceae bacterium]
MRGAMGGAGYRARIAFGIAANSLVLAITMGCSGSDSGTSSDSARPSTVGADASPESDAAGDATPLLVTCTPVAGGVGAVSVNNAAARQYYVDLPTDTSGPMALMFSWLGYNQAPLDFKNMLAFDPNGASMPIVIVTPTDTGLFLPEGLDWFIEGSSGNVDFPYFQGMLSCLESEFNIDTTRVYSFGFSAGAVFTNLLASQSPHLFAATVSESGAWFSDPAEVGAIVSGLGSAVPWDWPPLNPADRGDVLMTHGGPNDFATIISIESADQAALPYLLKNDRTVVDCAHTAGHAIDPLVSNQAIYEYLLAHKLGQPSPWSQLPADFPPGCTLNLP